MDLNKKDFKLRAKGLASHFKPTSRNAEEFHLLHEAIDLMDEKVSSLMITSPSDGEGTTTVSTNLAIVAAQTGKSILLIDANFRTPSLNRLFGLNKRAGLADFLAGNCSIKQSITFSGVRNLNIVTCENKPIDNHPSRLLHSPLFETLMREVTGSYDLVIIDTPALLPYSDAQVISQYTDGAILVVKNRNTGTDEALQAKKRLEASKNRVLGIVYNNEEVPAK